MEVHGKDIVKRYEYLLWYIAFVVTVSFILLVFV